MRTRPTNWLYFVRSAVHQRLRFPSLPLSLRTKLLIAAALVALPGVILSLVGDVTALSQLRSDVRTAEQSQAASIGLLVDSAIDEATSVGWAIAAGAANMPLAPGALDPWLESLAPVYRQFGNIGVYDASGNSVGEMVPYPAGQPRVNLGDSPYVKRALAGNTTVVSPVIVDRRTGQLDTDVVVPIRNRLGKPSGVVVVSMNLQNVRARIVSVSLPGSRLIVVADPTGHVALTTIQSTTPNLQQDVSGVPLVRDAMTKGQAYQESGPFDGLTGSWFGVATVSPRHHWVVSVIEPAGAATAPLTNAIIIDVVAMVGVLVLAIAGSVYVARQILVPLESLRDAARAWSRGDFRARVTIKTGDELETLGETFNSMAASLDETLRQLREADRRLSDERDRLGALLDTSPAGIVVVDSRQQPLIVNRAAQALLGIAFPGHPQDWVDLVSQRFFRPDGLPYRREDLPIVRSLVEGANVASADVLVRRPNGWEARLLVNSAPIKNSAGDVVGAVAVFVDISPLAEEERLRSEFVMSAAHEFRNPLTVIRGYAEVAMRDPVVRGTGVERELERILDAAARVERLAAELMQAASLRLPALILRTEAIEIASLTRATVEEFAKSDQGKGHEYKLATRPTFVHGDPALIREALTDLLRQAATVTPPGQPIDVSVSAWDGIANVAVTDRGPVIQEEEIASLFVPFSITTGTAPTGVAARPVLLLYLARRIIEESGGWMRARSSPGGTIISFALPRHAEYEEKSDTGTSRAGS